MQEQEDAEPIGFLAHEIFPLLQLVQMLATKRHRLRARKGGAIAPYMACDSFLEVVRIFFRYQNAWHLRRRRKYWYGGRHVEPCNNVREVESYVVAVAAVRAPQRALP